MRYLELSEEPARRPGVSKRTINNIEEEGQCAYCGWPLYIDDKLYFEIEDMEHLMFCSRGCAGDYLNNADWEPAN